MRLQGLKAKFVSIVLALGGAFVLFYLNYLSIIGWFGKTGPANLGSIEVSYVTMGKFLLDYGLPFFGNASWLPTWYMGFPMHVFYTPLLPFLEVFLNNFFAMDLWRAYRFITGVSYILAPISVFFFGWVLSKRFLGGLISGLIFSFGPSLIYLLVPEVYADRISYEFADPRRFTILVRWGEGPHTLSLVFIPLVGLFFTNFLRGKRYYNLVLASIFMGLTALTNSLGLFAGILLTLSITFIFVSQKKGIAAKRGILAFILLGIITLGLVSFWYNFSFITNFYSEGGGTLGKYINLFPWGWLGIAGVVVSLYLVFSKVVRDLGIGSMLLWFLIVFGIVGAYYLSGDEKLELMPQALRYNVEVDMALSLLIGVTFGAILRFVGKRSKPILLSLQVFGILVCAGISIYGIPFFNSAMKASSSVVDISKTREKEIADWLNQNVDRTKGERVLVPGNYAFYLNYFNDINQVRGGLFQAETHPWGEHAYFLLSNGRDKDLASAWLKILGIKYIVVPTISSSELYKDFKNIERFEGMDKVYNEKGDIFYKLSDLDSAIVKITDKESLKGLRKPKKADDKAAVLAYNSWINTENVSSGELKKINNLTYQINGVIGSNEGILVRMTYDPGWKVFGKIGNRNTEFKIKSDPLGFIYVAPQEKNQGNFEIFLKHEPTVFIWSGYLITLLTLIGIPVIYFLLTKKSGNI